MIEAHEGTAVRLDEPAMTSPARSLVPFAQPLPARRPPLHLVAAERMLPAARRTLAAAVVGFAAEYMLRALTNRALGRAIQAGKRDASGTTRTIVTEFVIVERTRRRR